MTTTSKQSVCITNPLRSYHNMPNNLDTAEGRDQEIRDIARELQDRAHNELDHELKWLFEDWSNRLTLVSINTP